MYSDFDNQSADHPQQSWAHVVKNVASASRGDALFTPNGTLLGRTDDCPQTPEPYEVESNMRTDAPEFLPTSFSQSPVPPPISTYNPICNPPLPYNPLPLPYNPMSPPYNQSCFPPYSSSASTAAHCLPPYLFPPPYFNLPHPPHFLRPLAKKPTVKFASGLEILAPLVQTEAEISLEARAFVFYQLERRQVTFVTIRDFLFLFYFFYFFYFFLFFSIDYSSGKGLC